MFGRPRVAASHGGLAREGRRVTLLRMKFALLTCVLLSGLATERVAAAQGDDEEQPATTPAAPAKGEPGSTETEQKPDSEGQKKGGSGLEWIYLNGEIGFEHLGLETFKATSNLFDSKVVPSTQTGVLYGAGAGIRIVFITLGARFRLGSFSNYQVWTLDGEVGLRVPLGVVEPYFTVSGGYASLGAFSAANLGGVSAGDVSVTGYDIRGGGGLDIYITHWFSIGASVTGEVLELTRPGVSISALQTVSSTGASTNPQQAQAAAGDIYKASGSSVGGALTGTAVIGLHF